MVVDSNDDHLCYQLLEGVNKLFGLYIDQSRFDDYIASPQNGYKAIQVTAWLPDCGAIEVAIATQDMEGENLWAWSMLFNTARTSATTARLKS